MQASVIVEPGETTELVLDAAKLSVDVVLGEHTEREPRIRARDDRGRMAPYDARRRLRSETYAVRDVVDSGAYGVEIVSYAR